MHFECIVYAVPPSGPEHGDCNVAGVSVLRRFMAFAALVVLVAAGRARLLEADEQRTGHGEHKGSPRPNGPVTQM